MLDGILKKIFGDKNQKDLTELSPIVDLTNDAYQQLQNLSDDQLRDKTAEFKSAIENSCISVRENKSKLKEKALSVNLSISEKEAIYSEIEKLDLKEDEVIEETLLKIMPQAFAVIKETSRRLAENGQLKVLANDNDKLIASKKEVVSIEGDHAIWKNKWDAAGSNIEWSMVHYDV